MKKSVKNSIILIVALFSITACSLDEVNYSSEDSSNYFEGEEQFEELVTHVYVMMRPLLRNTGLMWYGTDIYERTGKVDDTQNAINDYTTMRQDEGHNWWNDNYIIISRANAALDRGAEIENVTESIRRRREAELYTMRAYAYFNLVETFGGVPLIVNELSSPVYDFVRNTEEEVYTQIVEDLEIAIESGRLPETPEAYGRIAQGMAYHLLGKVLLTRSYKTFAKSDDLTKAISYFEKVIALHPLATNWNQLFGESGWANVVPAGNTEIIFAVRYSTTATNNGGSDYWSGGTWGNNLYQHFKFNISKFPGGDENDSPYRAEDTSYQPTAYFFSLYDETDIRNSEPYVLRTIYAGIDDNENGTNGSISANDPVIYFPKTAMTRAEKEAYMAANPPVCFVINPDEYHQDFLREIYTAYPVIYKFVDPGVTSKTWDAQNPLGTSDTYVFRVAETMMLLAEAYVKQGNGDKATGLINQLRNRAEATTLLTGTATIDDVLEESARELFGESNRWMDLKRTGTLLERAQKYNVFANKHNPTGIEEYYKLRPIPIRQIELSNGTLKQNEGYAGS
ncbi:MAG: RagB/SusD family nutrient uptake outer membrane protein [Tannerellaceae bacterium]|nr:RagB/SusD family nutrient uptake outer membrane protein [Tannerellaceae bacterium]